MPRRRRVLPSAGVELGNGSSLSPRSTERPGNRKRSELTFRMVLLGVASSRDPLDAYLPRPQHVIHGFGGEFFLELPSLRYQLLLERSHSLLLSQPLCRSQLAMFRSKPFLCRGKLPFQCGKTLRLRS